MSEKEGTPDVPPVWTKQASGDDVARVEREAGVLAELDGAGVVELEASGEGWFTTRVAGRRTLAEVAQSRGIGHDAAAAALAALDEIHSAGWCHGAATLDHAVVAPSGRVRWCSLGDARRIESTADPSARRERAAVEALLAAALPRGQRHRARTPRSGPPAPSLRRRSTEPVARHRGRAQRALAVTVAFALVAACAFVAFTSLADHGDPLDRAARLAALATGLLALYGATANAVLAVAWARRRTHLARRVAGSLPRWLAWLVVGSAGVAASTATAATLTPTMPTSQRVEMPSPTTTGTAPATPNTTTAATSTTTVPEVVDPPPPGPSSPPGAPSTSSETEAPVPVEAVVVKGDHLWGIAEHALARHLDRSPTDAEVAPYWRRLVETNRSRLVDPSNPDLIYAGQRFVLPPL